MMLSKFCQDHKKAIKWIILIFAALFTAFLYILYYLYLWYDLKTMGEMTYPLRLGGWGYLHGEIVYVAIRTREIIDGYWHISDPGLYERRNLPFHVAYLLHPYFYYFIYLFVGFKYVFQAGDFLIIAGSFILIFYLTYLLTRRYYISLFFSFMFLMVKNFLFLLLPTCPYFLPINNINQVKDLIKAFSPVILGDWQLPQRLNFLISESTAPSFLVFMLVLIFLFFFVKEKKFRYAIPLGVFYGLTLYAYPFYWIYITIALGLLGLAFLFQKKWAELWRLILAGAIGFLTTIFFWLNHLKLKALPNYGELLDSNFSAEYGHIFRWSFWYWYLLCILTVALIFLYAKKKNRMEIAYYFCLLFSAFFITFNMQVITGINFQSINWITRVIFVPMLFASAVIFTWFFEVLEARHKIWRGIVAASMIVLVIFQITGTVQGQWALLKAREKTHLLPKGLGEALLWMDKNLPKDSVILTPNFETNNSFLVYTPERTFIQYSFLTTASHKERLERLYVVYKFFGVAPEVFEKKDRKSVV